MLGNKGQVENKSSIYRTFVTKVLGYESSSYLSTPSPPNNLVSVKKICSKKNKN